MILDPDTTNNYKATMFKLGGSVNKVEGWEAYKETGAEMSVKAVFSYKEYEGATAPALVASTNALMVGGAKATRNGAATIADGVFWLGTGGSGDALVAFSEAEADAVTSVTVNGVACDYNVEDSNYVTVTWDQVGAAGQQGTRPWTFVVTTADSVYTIVATE